VRPRGQPRHPSRLCWSPQHLAPGAAVSPRALVESRCVDSQRRSQPGRNPAHCRWRPSSDPLAGTPRNTKLTVRAAHAGARDRWSPCSGPSASAAAAAVPVADASSGTQVPLLPLLPTCSAASNPTAAHVVRHLPLQTGHQRRRRTQSWPRVREACRRVERRQQLSGAAQGRRRGGAGVATLSGFSACRGQRMKTRGCGTRRVPAYAASDTASDTASDIASDTASDTASGARHPLPLSQCCLERCPLQLLRRPHRVYL
jgi:hypothetical protein